MDEVWRRKSALCCRVIVLVLIVWAGALLVPAQDIAVPVATQWSFFHKIFSFQRRVETGGREQPVLAVAYQSRFRLSLEVRNELTALLEEIKPQMGGLPLRVVEIDLSREEDVGAVFAARQVTCVYVAPLRAYDLSAMIRACRERKILSLTGVPEYIAQGLSVGIGNKGGKPHILINRSAALQEGVDFHSQLLKLATIVQ